MHSETICVFPAPKCFPNVEIIPLTIYKKDSQQVSGDNNW